MKLIQDYRALHTIPELGDDLPKTAAYLRHSLEKNGCFVFSPTRGSVCAWFDFGAEYALAFRADMDGLPIREETGLSFASCHPGQMHACGHDGHMAMLLALADHLHRHGCRHNVLLIFQPAEETTGGAQPLCRTGILEKYGVKAIFGMHLWPGLPPEKVFSRPGPMMSRSVQVSAEVTGRSAHITCPEQGADALAAGISLYQKLGALGVQWGMLHGGSAANVLAGHCRLQGTLRTYSDAPFSLLLEKMQSICDGIAQSGCPVDLHCTEGYPPVVNPPGLYSRVQALVPIDTLTAPVLATEDFSFYQQQVPGLFFFLGIGNTPPLHASRFRFDETVLQQGAAFWQSLADGWV